MGGLRGWVLGKQKKWRRNYSHQPKGEEFQYAIKLDFITTNNQAEYEAILARLSIAQEMADANVEVCSDSQVVVSHIQGELKAQRDTMTKYLDQVRKCQSYFNRVVLSKIPLRG